MFIHGLIYICKMCICEEVGTVYMHIHTYVRIYTYIHIYVYIYIYTRINTYSFIHFEEFKTITIMIMINRTPMLITRINSRMSSALRVWNAALVIH